MGLGLGLTSGGGGFTLSNKTATVPGTATGTIGTLSRLLGGTSTFATAAGTNANLTLSGLNVQATAAIGAGNSQDLVVQESDGTGRLVQYKVTYSGALSAPSVPAVTLTAGNGQISVAWVDGSNGGSPITSHNIYVNGVLIASPTGASPYVITGLPNGTPYGPIQVSAVNLINEGALSTGQTATPVAVVALLAGGRFAPMGNAQGANGDGLSNGTNVNSNCRITSYNLTGATINTMKLVFMNWADNGDSETSGVNPITYEASVEYPAGTFNRVTFNSGATSNTQSVDTTILSDEITLSTPIPNGAQYWIRTYVTVTSGQKFPMGYIMNTGTPGEATDWDTGVNKVLSGTITHTTTGVAQRGFGPVAALAISVTGVRKAKAWAGIGDSIINGTKTGVDFGTNVGWLGDAMYLTNLPYINISRPGAKIVSAGGAFTKRLDLIGKVGITDAIIDYGVNDISNNRTSAQVIADLKSFHTLLQTKGIRTYQTTITPYTVSPAQTSGTDPGTWLTSTSQSPASGIGTPVIAAGQYTGGTASERAKLNNLIRAVPAPFTGIIETADAVETGRDTGLWKTGSDASPAAQLMTPALGAVIQAGSTTTVVNVTVPSGANTVINGGAVVFRTGANAGVIKLGSANTASTITLFGTPLSTAPSAGDTIDIYPYGVAPVTDGLHPQGYNPYLNGVQQYGAAAVLAQVGKTWLLANN